MVSTSGNYIHAIVIIKAGSIVSFAQKFKNGAPNATIPDDPNLDKSSVEPLTKLENFATGPGTEPELPDGRKVLTLSGVQNALLRRPPDERNPQDISEILANRFPQLFRLPEVDVIYGFKLKSRALHTILEQDRLPDRSQLNEIAPFQSSSTSTSTAGTQSALIVLGAVGIGYFLFR